MGSNTGQGSTTDQFSYAQEANAEESGKPQFAPAPQSYSADSFETSAHASWRVPAQDHSPYRMPTPSTTSEVNSSWQTVGASTGNSTTNVDSHVRPLPFPMYMGADIPQSSDMGSNTGRRSTIDQFSYAQETNAEESGKPQVQVEPVPRSHSADNFDTSVHASRQAHWQETPEYTPPPLLSFPMPSYCSKPEYGMSQNFLIQFLVAYLII